MRRDNRSTTIRDVARAAGVSVSTVSRVLNDKDDVAPETSQRIRDVIADLGYTSSLAARSLRSHQTGVIGVVVPDLEDPFCIQVVKGIHHAIVDLNYDLIAYTSGCIKHQSRAQGEQRYVSLLNGSITDGIIVVTPAATRFPTSAPLVAIDPNNDCPDCLTVIAMNYAGAMDAVTYLIGLGHRRIGFIGGRLDLRCAQQRLEGYTAALSQAGISLDSDLVSTGDFSREMGRECARQLLSLPEPPSAIFAANDQSAIGAIEAANEAGRRVPEDLSVVGFDNIAEAGYFNPALTTVDQFIDKMGYLATELLVGLILGEPSRTTLIEVPTQLVVRKSCRRIA